MKTVKALVLVIAAIVVACNPSGLDNNIQPLNSNASSAGTITTAASYVNTYSFSQDGKTLTLTIDQSAGKNISHLLFKFGGTLATTTKTMCGQDSLTLANITSFTANGVDMMPFLGITEGAGNDCYGMLADPFVKLNHGFSDPIVVLVISFDVPVYNGVFVLKAGSANSPTGGGCFGLNDPNYAFSRTCLLDLPKCYQEESAWAAGQRYVTRGNWATYTAYAAGSTVNVYAGQNKWAGTATMSAISGGNVTITIALNQGWSLQEVSNPVKIQGYTTAPSGNPSPGRFASKGTELTVTLAAAKYYGIHLDLRQAVACPE